MAGHACRSLPAGGDGPPCSRPLSGWAAHAAQERHGSEEAGKWQAFRRYLENIERYGELEEKREIWDSYLPYAVAFGLEKESIQKFARVDAPLPSWYLPCGYDEGHRYRGRARQSGGGSNPGRPVQDGYERTPGACRA